jgi:ABC-type nitrate/sulfonate/bicarbonate transport system substrate-binding protein
MVSMFALAFVFLVAFTSRAAAENVKVGIPSLTVTMLPLAVARERGYFQQRG